MELLTEAENEAIRADPGIQAAFREAWIKSEATDPERRHEEGGFIVRRGTGFAAVVLPSGTRWMLPVPRLGDDRMYNGEEVVATYHTHPTPKEEPGGRYELEAREGDMEVMRKFPGDSYIIARRKIVVFNRRRERHYVISRRSLINM